jgi:hypothetical protein
MPEDYDFDGVEFGRQPLKGAARDEPHRKSMKASRLRLKEARGWFPAGDCVRRARSVLSDGAFKLYISISLDADASTGCFEATHKELATLLRKSKRIIGVYVREIEAKAVCRVQPARNQHAGTVFEVCDEYWPYYRIGTTTGGSTPQRHEQAADTDYQYVARIRKYFLGLGCVNGSFTPADELFARDLSKRGVAVETVESAMLMAAVRKYNSWLTNGASAPIGSLRYVDPVIGEIQQQPWPSGYREYLELKLRHLAQRWRESGNGRRDRPQGRSRPPHRPADQQSAGAKK